MKKTKATTASGRKQTRTAVSAKKPAARVTRSSTRAAVTAIKADEDALVLKALTGLLAVSTQMRELLEEIRDALVEAETAEPERVETIVIAETESPEPSEDEF